MKNLFIAIVFLFVVSCKEEVVSDTKAPGTVTVDSVFGIPGGAEILYSPPEDDDFSYVKASFLRQGVESYTLASVYTSKLKIEGLATTETQTVKLYSVDQNENVSEPVEVKVTPLTPPYIEVFNTLKIIPDFGGALFKWENKTGFPMQVELLAADSLGVLRSHSVIPSNMKEGLSSLRGFDTSPREFAAVVFDRWENYSDTLKKVIEPWYEEKFDKSLWKIVGLPNDHDWNAWGCKDYNMYDDDLTNECHSWGGTGWPQAFTLDLGEIKKLSRMNLWMRSADQPNLYYTHGNPKAWKVFGRVDEPDPEEDVPYDGDESWENIGWTLLLNGTPGNTDPHSFVMIRPSEHGGSPEEDLVQAINGAEFIFDVKNPEVRYLRVVIRETWDGANYVDFSELSFFGTTISTQ